MSAASYIGVGMFCVRSKKISEFYSWLDDSFIGIVILYSYAGFDYHIETLSQIDDTDGTTRFRGNYELYCNQKSM